MQMERHAPKGRAYRTPSSRICLISSVVLAQLFIAAILYFVYRSRHYNASPAAISARLLSEREALVSRIEAWNAKALASPASMGLPALALLTPGAQKSINNAQAASMQGSAMTATATAAQQRVAMETGGGQSLSSSSCEDPITEERFRMKPAAEVAANNPELAALVKKHAVNNEIMLTLANTIMICKNTTVCWWDGGNILESFITILKHNNITNHLIGVLDDETEEYLKGREFVNWFRVKIDIPQTQDKTHPANKVSTIKYTLLKDFIQMGVNTLITDMDLVYISNPFDHLHRDADIEVQTDGFDETAYGALDSVHDPSMGWGGGGLFFRTFTTNVGCMWVKANARTFKLMVQVSDQLGAKPGWDQQVFNEWLMRPSHGDHQSAHAHLRILDINKWVNSKIFFKSRRSMYLPGATSTAPTPILVHFNYHPDKHKRMLCIMDRYFYGNASACDDFPRGSEPGSR